ncbi:hypothetical protein DL770_007889 [Monosporascus sp. CRB-9-2]|nr:hypothetical protein DL770_007889 [Monosporascus sp. CRB-9-2]
MMFSPYIVFLAAIVGLLATVNAVPADKLRPKPKPLPATCTTTYVDKAYSTTSTGTHSCHTHTVTAPAPTILTMSDFCHSPPGEREENFKKEN